MTRGVCYIASREPYLSEAERSARSVCEHHPDLPIILYAPGDVAQPAVFDAVFPIDDPNHDFSDSNLTSERMPFDRTLFLDSDTFVIDSLDPVFDVLDEHDLAAAHDPTRTGTASHTHDHEVPETYPQYNTGVLAYRDTAAVRRLFDRWNELYNSLDGVASGLNQPAFRMAAYGSDVDIATLPPEWNFRWGATGNRVGYACGQIRVLHGRSAFWNPQALENEVNITTERRVIVIGETRTRVITHEGASDYGQVGQLVEDAFLKRQKDGVTGLARGVARTVVGGLT